MDYKAIKIPEDEFEKHKERKEQLGVSWKEYVDGQAPEVDRGESVDYAEIETRMERVLKGMMR